jgi:Protein of unknown function (DUF3551)
MRSPIISFAVLIAALLGKIQAASAQSPASYPWCARFFGGELVGATSCYFTSKEQCMTTLSGIGGYCYQSPYYHRSARAMRRADDGARGGGCARAGKKANMQREATPGSQLSRMVPT